MKKVSLVILGCLISVLVLAQNNTAVYQTKTDVWQNSQEKIVSIFTLELSSAELAEVKNKLEPLAKEVGYSVKANGNNIYELTLIFLEGTDPRYLTKMLVFLGVEKCLVNNEVVDVYSISNIE